MPQLSIYLDEKTLKKIELAAKLEKTSISKYIVEKINETFVKSWPKGYNNLFGSITDDNFTKPDKIDYSLDSARETI